MLSLFAIAFFAHYRTCENVSLSCLPVASKGAGNAGSLVASVLETGLQSPWPVGQGEKPIRFPVGAPVFCLVLQYGHLPEFAIGIQHLDCIFYYRSPMRFLQPLQQALLVRRYKRFLVDVCLENGESTTLHCPNTGSMKNCLAPGAPLWYSTSLDAKRKYAATWEIATTPAGDLAGINTNRANTLVKEALVAGLIPSLSSFTELAAEVRYGKEGSRIDFLLQIGGQAVYLEVKNVTLCEGEGAGYFPDAISQRGCRHLRELTDVVQRGHRAVLVYCVQHSSIESVAPARHIDSAYASAFEAALHAGVEVYALGARLSPQEIVLERPLPVLV